MTATPTAISTIDASTAAPSFALRADLTGVRALPLLKGLADFDKLDGRMQTKISVRSTGNSQRAIMAGLQGTTFVVFQDGAIKGLNVAQMIRSLTSNTLSGWQEGQELKTDLTQLSASFKIEKGQAVTTDLNLVGPLVRMTGVGTIALDTKQIGFRVEPKLVMTTEGQGRAGDPVGFGIPVMITGPWGAPKIYPDMQGILDNPDAAYAKLKEMGKGLFGPNSGGLGAALGGLLNGGQPGAAGGQPGAAGRPRHRQPGRSARRLAWRRPTRRPGGQPGAAGGQGAGKPGGDLLNGPLGEAIGNLLQQGLSGGRGQSRTRRRTPRRRTAGGAGPDRAAAEQPAQHSDSRQACRSPGCGARRADGAE